MDLYTGDLLAVLARRLELFPDPGVILDTEYPIASASADHLFPHGTKYNNTRYPRFCYRCERIFKRPLRFLDLGCAGGGLVLDFLLRGHFALGIEGSDYSLLNQRAEWRLLPNHLMTCDATRPFKMRSRTNGETVKFDVVSAWEVLEHIEECDLPQFFANVLNHMADDAIFVASVATREDQDKDTGAKWHVTVKPREWWLNVIDRAGFLPDDDLFDIQDFPRLGGGAVSFTLDWNAPIDAHGFPLVAHKKNLARDNP